MSKNTELYPGSEYRGFVAGTCVETTWTDRYGSGQSLPVYKLTLQTPFTPAISNEELDYRLKKLLSDVFPDIGLISHHEASRRCASDDVFVPVSCRKVINWAAGHVNVEMLLLDEFRGFPVEEEDETPEEGEFSGEIDTELDDALNEPEA